jgi:hypothetical protein
MYKRTKFVAVMVAFVLIAMVFPAVPVMALETTGVPGSPSATTTISGKQLPAPAPKFGGVIKDDALNSTQWWPVRAANWWVPTKTSGPFSSVLTLTGPSDRW